MSSDIIYQINIIKNAPISHIREAANNYFIGTFLLGLYIPLGKGFVLVVS